MQQHNSSPQSVVVVVIFTVTLLSTIIIQSNGRELRPADHGLSYQQNSLPPAQNDAGREMQSFFGTTTPSLSLPEAQNIGGDTSREGRSRETRMDHVRVGLMVASGLCGLTGVVLLLVSGIVFLFRLQKRNVKEDRISATSASTSDVSVPHQAVGNDDKK